MNRVGLQDMTPEQLVGRFATLALAQNEALLMDDIAKVNRLYRQLKEIEGELKAREGDQRRALLSLYDHANAQVRLKAVKATLAVAPTEARRKLQIIADSREYPQAAEAGMSLRNLDQGIYKPS
jgi:predicted component of type VI protein secretion system